MYTLNDVTHVHKAHSVKVGSNKIIAALLK